VPRSPQSSRRAHPKVAPRGRATLADRRPNASARHESGRPRQPLDFDVLVHRCFPVERTSTSGHIPIVVIEARAAWA
jgi:hypothetical protein